MSTLKIAVCQHRLSGNISENLDNTIYQLRKASKQGADIVQFPECNLTGYAGVEFSDYHKRNNDIVEEAIDEIKSLAAKLKIWIIVGGYWFEKDSELPYNSVFVINSIGKLECRYDKRLLTAGDSGDDVDYFSPGSGPVIFLINGIKCGLLICHEWRYPELYREYKGLGVDLIFQSWYDANVNPADYKESGADHGSLIIGSVRSNAANNYLWVSGSNASNRESSFGSFLIQPDGAVRDKLPRNRPGILITEVNTSQKYIDPSSHNRNRFF